MAVQHVKSLNDKLTALEGRGLSVGMPTSPHTSELPAKKQRKWSPEEDAAIIKLRGQGMQWRAISEYFPGRSPTSCRLHYQNYLENGEWDEEQKTKLARIYERYKPPESPPPATPTDHVSSLGLRARCGSKSPKK